MFMLAPKKSLFSGSYIARKIGSYKISLCCPGRPFLQALFNLPCLQVRFFLYFYLTALCSSAYISVCLLLYSFLETKRSEQLWWFIRQSMRLNLVRISKGNNILSFLLTFFPLKNPFKIYFDLILKIVEI